MKNIDLAEFFNVMNDITRGYEISNIRHSFSRPTFTDRYELIEKPGWREKFQRDALGQEINIINNKISRYQSQIDHLLSIQAELSQNKKDLEKELKKLDKKKE